MKSIIFLQTVVALVVALVCLLFGQTASLAAVAGAATVLLPNVFFALYLSVFKPSVVRFFIGAGMKLLVMVCVFALVSREYGFLIHVPAYWVALIVVVKAHGLNVLRATK